jgi:hypothetical protein
LGRRSRGWSRRCKKWRFAADAVLGLEDSARSPPAVLEELLVELEASSPTRETVVREAAYLREHQPRMDYRRARRRKEPLGSGAVEATCAQYQCRFKRTGQFWSPAGDEALLCLDTFWRNERWHLLFPHTRPPNLSKN